MTFKDNFVQSCNTGCLNWFQYDQTNQHSLEEEEAGSMGWYQLAPMLVSKSDWLVLKVKDRTFVQSPLNFYLGGISLFQSLFVGVSPGEQVKYKIIMLIINIIQTANQLFDHLDNTHDHRLQVQKILKNILSERVHFLGQI